LLDAVVGGLKRLPTVALERVPRMADFAMWATACEEGLGLAGGEFLEVYEANGAEDAISRASPRHSTKCSCIWLRTVNWWKSVEHQ